VIDVVSGVLVRNRRVLLTQRRARDRVFPLDWECPGGKVDEGETLRRALVRELLEEIAFDDDFAPDLAPFFVVEFPNVLHDRGGRPALPVRVHFFLVRTSAGFVPRLREVDGAGWFTRAQALTLPLLPSCDVLFRAGAALRSMGLVESPRDDDPHR